MGIVSSQARRLDWTARQRRALHGPPAWPLLVHITSRHLLPDTLAFPLFLTENQQVRSSQRVLQCECWGLSGSVRIMQPRGNNGRVFTISVVGRGTQQRQPRIPHAGTEPMQSLDVRLLGTWPRFCLRLGGGRGGPQRLVLMGTRGDWTVLRKVWGERGTQRPRSSVRVPAYWT